MQKLWTHCSFFAGFHLVFPCFWLSPKMSVTHGEMIQVQTGMAHISMLCLRLWLLWAKEGKLCPAWERRWRNGIVPFSHMLFMWAETAGLIANLELACGVLGSFENAGAGLGSAECKWFCVQLHKSFQSLPFLPKEKKIFHDKPVYFLHKCLS